MPKVLIKKTKKKTTPTGRMRHRFQVFADNGELIVASPSNQPYYNQPELIEAMKITRDALTEFLKDK
jgi:hypothetical protein